MTGFSDTRLETLADPEALARRVADWLLAAAVGSDHPFVVALSGGSTPRRLYELLSASPYREAFPWARTHWFWGDERFVPHDSRESNYRMVREAMLARVPVPTANVHPVPTEGLEPQDAARSYERELKSFYGAATLKPDRPLFDVTLLGLGPEGHIASLFPGTAILRERTHWVGAVIGAKPEPRITLTYPALESSREVAFLVAGAEKRPVLEQLLKGDPDLPAAHLHPVRGSPRFFLDRAAAPRGTTITGHRCSGAPEGAKGMTVSSRLGPHTLAIDIGGTALKASVLDSEGRMVVERVRLPTPYPCPPEVLLGALEKLAASLPAFDRISIGFPGVVRDGQVVTAPHFAKKAWRGYPLEAATAERLERPARLLNDAEVQGLGIIAGRGLEVVLTLGTGIGSAVFADGRLAPHLELAHHPLHDGDTYNEHVGNDALHQHGTKRWNRRVLRMIEAVESLLNYDMLYLGGGNARHITADLPENVRIASNVNGITGGIHLWNESIWRSVRGRQARHAEGRQGVEVERQSSEAKPQRRSDQT